MIVELFSYDTPPHLKHPLLPHMVTQFVQVFLERGYSMWCMFVDIINQKIIQKIRQLVILNSILYVTGYTLLFLHFHRHFMP